MIDAMLLRLNTSQNSKKEMGHPSVVVNASGVARLRAGHVWVYRSDLLSAEGVPPGARVRVLDQKRRSLGTALYSSSSQIAIRMISSGVVQDLSALVRQRIREAIAYRGKVVSGTDAY